MAPTSFASAAAGINASSPRADTIGDWPRRANGATQTFRRTSHATTPSGSTSQAHSRDTSIATNAAAPSGGVYVPPHAQPGRNGGSAEGRYSRDQLIDLYRENTDRDVFKEPLQDLYVNNWEPHLANGVSGPSWGRRDDQGAPGQNGVDSCWDKEGHIEPLSLSEMTSEEREVFISSVNSPIKPLAQNTNKDGTPKEPLSARKTSISHGGGTPYGVSSPTPNRPSNRRRETNDAYPFPSTNTASPSVSRFAREESNTVAPPPALMRRRTDFKEPAGGSTDDRDKDKSATETTGPFAGLKRTTTAPFAAAGAASWGTTSPASAFSSMGAFGNFTAPPVEKKPGYGSLRGESRFKGLMNKPSIEDFAKGPREKPSLRDLNRASGTEASKAAASWMEARTSRPVSNDTDPTDDMRTGSAALLGGADTSPTEGPGFNNFATPHKRDQRDPSGFTAFGLPTGESSMRDIFGPPSSYQQTPQQQRVPGGQEPMSPTDTNPYQSPEHERPPLGDDDSDGGDVHQQFPGMGSFQIDSRAGPGQHPHGFGGLPGLGRVNQPYEIAPSDRSQTSSVGPTRGFAPLPGLGTLSGLGGSSAWGPPQVIGTPVRERGGFDLFGASTDAQSPSLPGLGSNALFGGAGGLGGPGTIGRTSSRLGSLFPQAMQDQMRQGDQRQGEEGAQDDRLHSLTGTFGRGAFGSQAPGSSIPARDTASPLRRGLFDAFSGTHAGMDDAKRDAHEPTTPFGPLSAGPSQTSLFSAAQPSMNSIRTALPTTTQPPGISTPTGQPPAPQQRTMVMPDRMRWIYRDPEGRTQGPFSGLEMHDWYKAGFFSPELLVKKFEDPDYEPLAQLIRRIGNSREPFLVPQIGIPHGPPTTQPGNAWAGAGLTAGPGAGAQPPFANNFPTFGTTLTAEQQNALERRKQEEQYLMAQQKDFLAIRQQALAKQTQLGGIGHGVLPHQLQHHSSSHSLHSQPSFGSITSPGGYQPAPTQGPLAGGPAPVPGLFDTAFRAPPVPGLGPIGPGMDIHGGMRDEDVAAMMERLQIGRTGQPPFGTAQLPLGQQPDSNAHAQQVINTYLGDRARLQREQEQHDLLQRTAQNEQQAAQASADRLQQFHDLRLQTNVEQAPAGPPEGVIGKPAAPAAEPQQQQVQQHQEEEQKQQQQQQQPQLQPQKQKQKQQDVSSPVSPPAKPQTQVKPAKTEQLSLTEQVQKTQAKQTPSQAAWGQVEPAIHPFPPPPSQSPLPAPAAQRKPIVANDLAGESRSQTGTPTVETPSASIAPWAKEPTEAPKGPSLKEIQEAEAKKAAEREAIAAAARREAAEKELLAQAQSPAAQPGLPSTSTWGSTASPSTPVGAGQSAWAKPATGKAAGTPGAAAKKTLQQIQKEEEARKLRQAQAQAATVTTASAAYSSPSPALASGKRYADLASKPTSTLTPSTSGAWTTVGASGKVKAPVVTPIAPAALRTPTATPTMAKKTIVTRSTATSATTAKANAEDEFKKWAINELRGELDKDINTEDFVSSLYNFPAEIELITESVHSASHTLDSRHFAEEFIRRRKQAEKGIFDYTSSPIVSKSSGGDWSEVAKKGGQQQQQQPTASLDNAGFKIIQTKKKAGKR